MARLKDTVIHGLLDVYDDYYITEKKRKLARIRNNNLLILGDQDLNTTIYGINMLLEATGTTDIKSSKQVTILMLVVEILI